MKNPIKVILLSFLPSILTTGFAYAKVGIPEPGSPVDFDPDYAVDSFWDFDDDLETFRDVTFGFVLRKASDAGVLNGAIFRLYDSMEAAIDNDYPYVFTVDESEKDYTACPLYDCPFEGGRTYDITAGIVSVNGLYPGTYYLDEKLPPAGYQRIHNPYQIVITDTGTVYYKEMLTGDVFLTEAPEGLITVWNHKAVETLPSSGGPGNWPFYAAGLGCILAALCLAFHLVKAGRGGKNV